MSTWDMSQGRQIANFHMLFNIGLVVLCFPLVNSMAKLTANLLPEDPEEADDIKPRHLDILAFENPLVAIVNAEREVLRMGEVVERMLRNTFVALKKNDIQLAQKTQSMDKIVNLFDDEIKRYLTSLAREPLTKKESKRCIEIINFGTNLEHIGDIITVDLIQNIAQKKVLPRAKMSLQDRDEINNLYQPVLKSFHLSMNVFSSGDITMARQLMATKYKVDKREKELVVTHLNKLRDEVSYDSKLSALQLDILRDLKRINYHLTSVAYPILEKAGQLRTRMRSAENSEASAQTQLVFGGGTSNES